MSVNPNKQALQKGVMIPLRTAQVNLKPPDNQGVLLFMLYSEGIEPSPSTFIRTTYACIKYLIFNTY